MTATSACSDGFDIAVERARVQPRYRGLAHTVGPRQIGFSLIILALCLLVPYVCAKIAGLPLGYAAGLYAGSQTISASIGVASGQIAQLGLPADQAKVFTDQIPIGYAVTYIFGTIGSAIILATLGPRLIGVDLPRACAEYEKALGGKIGTGDYTEIPLPGGHVGLFVSSKSQGRLSKNIAEWLAARD